MGNTEASHEVMAPKQARRRMAEGDLSVAGVVEIRAQETSVPLD